MHFSICRNSIAAQQLRHHAVPAIQKTYRISSTIEEHMDSTQAALVFFFGMFWASALSAVAPLQVFDTRLLFRRGQMKRGWCRLVVGLVIVDILPVVGLCLLLNSPLMEAKKIAGVATAAIASLSVFSVQRFLHASVATDRFASFYYSADDLTMLESRGKTVDGFWEHFVPALFYLIVPLTAAVAISRLM